MSADQNLAQPHGPGAFDATGLMQLALESPADPAQAPHQDSAPLRFVLPKIEDLAAAFPELEVQECIGRGGMGCVFKARQKHLDRLVALKVLPAELGGDSSFAERFTREARAMARLGHPNIVTVHDFGHRDGLSYLVMEHMDGMNLRELLQAERLTPAEALSIAAKVCEALQYAHDEGIVHRDVKPENILFDRRGHVKIADFGLAKLVAGTHDATLTGSRQAMGTPYYMAPEQWESSHDVDHRADVYAVGVILYEMLTGRVPLGRFEPPSQTAGVNPRLDEIVLRAMQREPERRYQRADELQREIERLSSPRLLPERIVPTLPRMPEGVHAFVGRAQGVLLRGLSIVAEAFRRVLPTAIAAGIVAGVSAADWVIFKLEGGRTDTFGFPAYFTAILVGDVLVANYWPVAAAAMLVLLALIRPWLGLKSDLLAILLSLYGLVHVGLFFASDQHHVIHYYRYYFYHQQPPTEVAHVTIAPLVVGGVFAVLFLGSVFGALGRIFRTIEGERGVRTFLKSAYRQVAGETTFRR